MNYALMHGSNVFLAVYLKKHLLKTFSNFVADKRDHNILCFALYFNSASFSLLQGVIDWSAVCDCGALKKSQRNTIEI